MEKLGLIEIAALAQALYKVTGQAVNTKDPDSLRGQVDRYYKAQYEQTGSKSYDININGVTVGTYSIKFTKEKPPETRKVFNVNDYIRLSKWASTLTSEEILGFFGLDLQPLAEWWFATTGELADGCEMLDVVTLAQPKQYDGGMLKVKPEKFAEALGNALPSSVVGLLGEAS